MIIEAKDEYQFFTMYSFVETVQDIQVTLEQKVNHGRDKKVCLLVKWPSRFLILLCKHPSFTPAPPGLRRPPGEVVCVSLETLPFLTSDLIN